MNMREPRLMPVGETGSADVTGMLIDHLDLWTGAVTTKSTAGRGRNGKIELTGIKKLRELILELAVRGKLVEQDPSDEPASVLLERIAEEKARLVKEGKIKKPKKLPEVSIDEKAFSIPSNWQWDRLERLFIVVTDGDHQAPPKAENGTPFLVISNINSGEVDFAGCRKVPDNYYNELDWTRKPVNGDLLYTVTGSYGIPMMVNTNQHFCVQRHVAILKPSESTPTSYFKVLLSSPYAKHYAASIATGIAQKTVPLTGLRKLPVALPPLEEQHRIVEKVDELMALCDRLEQQVGDQLEAHEVLVDTLLDALTRSADAAELAESWARVEEHFDTLFTTEVSIDKLKQTILQLAVMGRLVPQDTYDESASVLLEKIAEEKARLGKEGKIKKPKKLPEVAEEEKSFEAPPNWAFTRVAELYDLQNGYAFKSGWFSHSGIKLLRNINISHGVIDWSECALLPESMASEYQRFSLRSGDLVISLDRPLISTGLKYSVVKEKDLPCLLLQRVARFQPYSDTVITRYLEYWLNSAMFTSSIDPGRSNGVPHISTGQIGKVVFPLPPKDEQHRIVEKVDELMALCDQLKARLVEAGETRTQLAEAVVEQAVS